MTAVLIACLTASASVALETSPAGVTVRVDRRVELVSAAERLAGAPEYAQGSPTAYLRDLDQLLAPFAHHPAIELTRALQKANIAFDAPMSFAILFDDPRRDAALRAEARWNKVDPDAWAGALRQLEQDAKLDAFWDAHAAYIGQVEERFAEAIARDQPQAFFAALLGPSTLSYRVVPSLINGSTNYGLATATERVQIMGLGDVDAKGLPELGDETLALLVHEMGHSFVNPMVDARRAGLEAAAAPLFAAMETELRANDYGAVNAMIYESCVRALTTLFARERHGADAGADAARREIARGFVWTPALTELFATLHSGGVRSLDALAPQLVAFFAATSKQFEHGVPPHAFPGTLGGLGKRDNTIVHAPDARLAAALTGFRDRILPGVPLRAATAADRFETAPPGHLRLYGSPASSPLIADLVRRAGWSISDGAIALGSRRFTGPGLVLIACWPRPGDPNHGVLVSTAARDADVVGINGMRAPGDFGLGRRPQDGRRVPGARARQLPGDRRRALEVALMSACPRSCNSAAPRTRR